MEDSERAAAHAGPGTPTRKTPKRACRRTGSKPLTADDVELADFVESGVLKPRQELVFRDPPTKDEEGKEGEGDKGGKERGWLTKDGWIADEWNDTHPTVNQWVETVMRKRRGVAGWRIGKGRDAWELVRVRGHKNTLAEMRDALVEWLKSDPSAMTSMTRPARAKSGVTGTEPFDTMDARCPEMDILTVEDSEDGVFVPPSHSQPSVLTVDSTVGSRMPSTVSEPTARMTEDVDQSERWPSKIKEEDDERMEKSKATAKKANSSHLDDEEADSDKEDKRGKPRQKRGRDTEGRRKKDDDEEKEKDEDEDDEEEEPTAKAQETEQQTAAVDDDAMAEMGWMSKRLIAASDARKKQRAKAKPKQKPKKPIPPKQLAGDEDVAMVDAPPAAATEKQQPPQLQLTRVPTDVIATPVAATSAAPQQHDSEALGSIAHDTPVAAAAAVTPAVAQQLPPQQQQLPMDETQADAGEWIRKKPATPPMTEASPPRGPSSTPPKPSPKPATVTPKAAIPQPQQKPPQTTETTTAAAVTVTSMSLAMATVDPADAPHHSERMLSGSMSQTLGESVEVRNQVAALEKRLQAFSSALPVTPKAAPLPKAVPVPVPVFSSAQQQQPAKAPALASAAATANTAMPPPPMPMPIASTPMAAAKKPLPVGMRSPTRPAKSSRVADGPVILPSNLKSELLVHLSMATKKMGGVRADSFSDKVTHVVLEADDDRRALKRTTKYAQGILTGKWVVSFKWVLDSFAAEKWLDETPYEIVADPHSSSGAPRNGRLRASRGDPPLFARHQFFVAPSITRDLAANLADSIVAGGGELLHNTPPPPSKVGEVLAGATGANEVGHVVHILAPPNLTIEQAKLLYMQCGRHPISYEWVLDCVSRYMVIPAQTYELAIAAGDELLNLATQHSLAF